MKPNNLPEPEPQSATLLEPLRAVPPRSAEDAARSRARFLEQAQTLKATRPAVSVPVNPRHKGWNIFPFWRKEPNLMTTLASILLILSLMFGGASATVYAAQGSQPDQPLYGLKLASEDARLEMAAQTQSRLKLALEFANRRVEEIAARVRAGQDIPAPLAARYQNQVEFALKLAAGMSDEEMPGQLEQMRLQLREQARLMEQLKGEGPAEAQLLQLREQLQLRLRAIDNSKADPAGFRNQVKVGFGSEPNDDPGKPWVEDTQPGYGPGPGTCEDCVPAGSEYKYKYGGEPTPGTAYGPGPGPGPEACETCTPQGTPPEDAGTSPGPQPEQPPTDTQGVPQPSQGGSNGGGNGGKP